jgi:hypothetical protein
MKITPDKEKLLNLIEWARKGKLAYLSFNVTSYGDAKK